MWTVCAPATAGANIKAAALNTATTAFLTELLLLMRPRPRFGGRRDHAQRCACSTRPQLTRTRYGGESRLARGYPASEDQVWSYDRHGRMDFDPKPPSLTQLQ